MNNFNPVLSLASGNASDGRSIRKNENNFIIRSREHYSQFGLFGSNLKRQSTVEEQVRKQVEHRRNATESLIKRTMNRRIYGQAI